MSEEFQRRSTDPRVEQLVVDMQAVKEELALNTAVTTQVRDAINSFKMIARIAKWIGVIAACAASMVAAVKGVVTFNDVK